MSTKHAHKKPMEFSADDFPALTEFLRGYFHEDLADDYGSPQGAARQFCHDADSDQRRAVAGEWSRFLMQTKNQPIAVINEILTTKLGSAALLTENDMKKVSTVFNSDAD